MGMRVCIVVHDVMTVFGIYWYRPIKPCLEVGDSTRLEFHAGNRTRRMRNEADEKSIGDPGRPDGILAILRQIDDVVVPACTYSVCECLTVHK